MHRDYWGGEPAVTDLEAARELAERPDCCREYVGGPEGERIDVTSHDTPRCEVHGGYDAAPMMLPLDPPLWWAMLVAGVCVGLLSLITVIALGFYG